MKWLKSWATQMKIEKNPRWMEIIGFYLQVIRTVKKQLPEHVLASDNGGILNLCARGSSRF